MSKQVFGFFGGAVLALAAAVLAPAAMAQTMPMPPPNNEAQITIVVTPANGVDFATGSLEHNVPVRYRASIQDADGLPDPLVVSWKWRTSGIRPDAATYFSSGGNTGATVASASSSVATTGGLGVTSPVLTSVKSYLPGVGHTGTVQAAVGATLQLCASFTDAAMNAEEACVHNTAVSVNTINDAPTGRPALFQTATSGSSTTTTAVAGAVTQGWNLYVNTTDGATVTVGSNTVANPGGTSPAWATTDLADPDGLPRGRTDGDYTVSFQNASSADGPWTEVTTSSTADSLNHVVTQADVNAGWLRACVFYEDEGGFDNGGPSDTAAERALGTVCTTARSVTNVNDLPTTAEGGRIYVSVDYNAANPYFFTAEDFGFADVDPGDSLASVEITTLPPKNAAVSNLAAFRLGSDTVTAGLDVSLAQIPTLSYYRPTTGAGAGPGYDRFTYKVTDNNGGESAAAGTIEIDLVETNAPARGAPAVIAETSGETAYNEDITLAMSITDSSHSVVDVNGIDTTTLTYQWQFAMPLADDPAAIPPPDAYQDLFGSTNATYTPTQQRVGQYIRGCISFTDNDGNAEGPLCSVPPLPISNTNDAPTTANATITASTDYIVGGTAFYRFTPEDFPFSDGDPDGGDSLASVIFVSLPTAGTAYVDGRAMTMGEDVPVSKMDGTPRSAGYGVPSGATASSTYATFTFRVVDDGSDGTDNTQSEIRTMTVNLVQDLQIPATGAPAVTATTSSETAYNEDVQLTANYERTTDGITLPAINDNNDYVAATIDWQWQQADGLESPWSDIAGATATGTTSTFTPTQAQVGKYVRACASFTDADGHAEGPLCNVPPSAIANTNDAPTSANFSVDVSVNYWSERPFVIDFDLVQFMDADEGGSMEEFRIVTPPTEGTLAVQARNGSQTAITAARSLDANSLQTAASNSALVYYPAAGDAATPGYDSIEFQVADNALAASPTYTITINLVPASGQTAATGAPSAFGTRNQGAILSASESGLVEPDGIDPTTRVWQWQQSTNAEGPWADIPGANSDILHLLQPQVKQHVRVCLTYTDMGSPPAREGPYCGGGPAAKDTVRNINDSPEGDIVIAQDGDDLVQLAELVEGRVYSLGLTTGGGNFADADGLQTRLLAGGGRTSWQVTDDPDDSSSWAEIDYAGRGVSERARSLTITQADADAGYMRVCLFYRDVHEMREGGASATEAERLAGTVCTLAVAVRGINSAPTGAPLLVNANFSPLQGNAKEDSDYIAIITSRGGTVADAEGMPPTTTSNYQTSVQTAASANGPWNEIEFEAKRLVHEPGQAQVGQWLRHCIFYVDNSDNVEGFAPGANVPTTTANNVAVPGTSIPALREAGTLCTAPVMVDNVNDAPEALRSSVTATLAHTETSPFVFSAEDFGFTDEDGDAMKGIVVVTLPTKGTLALPADATVNLIAGREINLAAVNGLRWWPPDNASASNNFTYFDFRVRDDGTDPDADTNTLSTSELSNQAIRMTINLVNTARTDKVAAGGHPHISSPGGYIEGATLTAGPKDLTDGNGINLSTLTWTWYSRASTDSSMGSTVSATSVTTAANGWASVGTGASFTIPATLVGHWMAVCATFDDLHPSDVTSESRCRGIDLQANLTVGNVNYPPTGTPAVSSDDGRDLTAVPPITGATLTAMQGTLMDADGLPDFSDTSATYWQWLVGSAQELATGNGLLASSAASYTLTDATLGQYVALCPSYTDGHGVAEAPDTRTGHCWISPHKIAAPPNNAPGGRVVLQIANVDSATAGLTAIQDNVSYSLAATTGGGNLMDADGLAMGSQGNGRYGQPGEGISYQASASASGPWTEMAFGGDRSSDGRSFKPVQAQVGQYMRACLFYIDGAGHLEGGDSTSPATRAAADSTSTCTAAVSVVNGNNKPESADFRVSIPVGGGSYTFKRSDFAFDDQDGDNLVSVRITARPGADGFSLARSGTEIMFGTSANNSIPIDEIGNLVLTVSAAAASAARNDVESIIFRLHDDGTDRWPSELALPDNNTSDFSASHDIAVDIVPTAQQPATGDLTFIGSPTTFAQKSAIAAGHSSIEDPNSINERSIRWQWSQADPSAADATMPGDWAAIAGADEREFTPEQPQVGKFLRVCMSFMDQHETPAANEFCLATTAAVTDANDAPTSADASVQVPTAATRDRPYRFAEADFPFADVDPGHQREGLSLVEIVSLPRHGTLTTHRGIEVTQAGTTVQQHFSGLDPLFYYPPAGASPAAAYDSFRFRVRDTHGAQSHARTMTIELRATPQMAAGGQLVAMSMPDGGALDIVAPREDATIVLSADAVTDVNGIDATSFAWQWSAAANTDVPVYAPVAGATGPSFMPLQAQVGQLLRGCLLFRDGLGAQEQICWDSAGPVQNTDDPTMAVDSSVDVFRTATFGNPFVFLPHYFLFQDDDSGGHALEPNLIFFDSVPTTGTLLRDTGSGFSQVLAGDSLRASAFDRADDMSLVFYPDAGAAVTADYASFRFRVQVRREDNTREELMTEQSATMTINLVSEVQQPASGQPFMFGINDQGSNTRAVVNTLADPNGINLDTLRWQWQLSGDDGNYSDAEDGTGERFVVPQPVPEATFMRVCATFEDKHSTPNTEGPICSQGVRIGDLNDPPTSADVAVNVPVDADADNPFKFAPQHFPFMDPDLPGTGQAIFEGILLQGLPSAGTMLLDDTMPTSLSDHPVSYDFIHQIGFYPDAGATPQDGYATFEFAVEDEFGLDSVEDYTLTINLVAAGTQIAASGGPNYFNAFFPNEDREYEARLEGISEPNGIDQSTVVWQWQIADSEFGTYSGIAGANEDSYTPPAADVGRWIRACASFSDNLGNNEGQLCGSGRLVNAQNDGPTTADAQVSVFITATADEPFRFGPGNFPFMDEEDAALHLVQLDSVPLLGTLMVGDVLASSSTRVRASELSDMVYWPEPGASAAQNYASFSYRVADSSNGFSRISIMRIHLVPPGPLAATGAPSLSAPGPFAEDVPLLASTTGINDPNGIDPATLSWAWQIADAETGPWAPIPDADEDSFTPLQTHVNKWLRVCLSFRDLFEVPTAEGPLCSTPAQVINVNDVPTSADASVEVFTIATNETPFVFSTAHFPFVDEDFDDRSLHSLTLVDVGNTQQNGALLLGETAVTNGAIIRAAEIATLVFYPNPNPTVGEGYASFTFSLSDGTASTQVHTLRIDIVPPRQAAAMGAPTVAATDPAATAYNEDVPLTATTQGISDVNGINRDSLAWQWQSAAAPATGAPQESAWADIADASAATFTPLQAHVGLYLRVCASFDDEYQNPATGEAEPASEGPLCSIGVPILNVNDAPTSADSDIYVFTVATADDPYIFSADDFPFADEDEGDSGVALTGITLLSIPSLGTLRLDDQMLDNVVRTIDVADIPSLTYHQEAGATEARDNYASFTFTVSDGLADSATHRMTINIVPPNQMAATGAPAITGDLQQNATLAAAQGTVRDPNGIDRATITWQWQQAASTSGTFTDIAGASGAEAAEFIPAQAQVGQHLRVCMTFMDRFFNRATMSAEPNSETRCSEPTTPIANVNDAPSASDVAYRASRIPGSDAVLIPASAFAQGYSDIDGQDDRLESISLVRLPAAADGTLSFAGREVAAGQTLAVAAGGDFVGGQLLFAISGAARGTALEFSLSDGEEDSNTATLTITFGKDIEQRQVQQASAILGVAAVTNAANAISGAISAAAPLSGTAFDLAANGTSLLGLGRSLHDGIGPAAIPRMAEDNSQLPAGIATADQRAWYMGTADSWQYQAAANATDNSAATLMRRINALADGDVAMSWQPGGLADTRLWARWQRLDISGKPRLADNTQLRYSGDSSGFYVGADQLITDGIRAGMALGFDDGDIMMDLDEDGQDDSAHRNATSFYPYMRMDLQDGNELRVIAGFGSGDLDINSSANQGSATAGVAWQMLAATLSHSRHIKQRIALRLDGSAQYSGSDITGASFDSGARIMDARASSGELAMAAEVRYHQGRITPFVTTAMRRWYGDLSQAPALDLGAGADIKAGPLSLRAAIIRQINSTIHRRHSMTLDISLAPSASGISASLGSTHDSITGKPQWNSTIKWQYPQQRTTLSLTAAPRSLRLQAQYRW